MPTTAAKLSCQPRSPVARGSRPRVRGREQERVPARPRPAGERGDDPGCAHDAGALDRGPRPGDQDVDRDQRQDPGSRARRGTPSRASSAAASSASRTTFWPMTASRWASPERLNSSPVRSSMRSSWPRTKPRSRLADRRRSPRPAPPRRERERRRAHRRARRAPGRARSPPRQDDADAEPLEPGALPVAGLAQSPTARTADPTASSETGSGPTISRPSGVSTRTAHLTVRPRGHRRSRSRERRPRRRRRVERAAVDRRHPRRARGEPRGGSAARGRRAKRRADQARGPRPGARSARPARRRRSARRHRPCGARAGSGQPRRRPAERGEPPGEPSRAAPRWHREPVRAGGALGAPPWSPARCR